MRPGSTGAGIDVRSDVKNRGLLPRHVQVQTVSWCNRGCAFCPSRKFPREAKLMEMAAYERILGELASEGFAGRFSPYLQGEPMLDPRMAERVARARARLPEAKILIQSNGDLMTVEKGEELFRMGLHKLILNCYDDEGGRLEGLRNLAKELARRVPGLEVLTRGEFGRMALGTEAGEIRKQIAVTDKTWWKHDSMENWAGNVPSIPPLVRPLRRSCFRPFEQLYVRWNGDAVLCCCDWKGEVVLGNLLERPLREVFNSEVAARYRRSLERKDRNLPLCRSCDFKGAHPWGERMLARMSRWTGRG